jgi:hypothetical protein
VLADGAAKSGEVATGYNFIRDGLFGKAKDKYTAYDDFRRSLMLAAGAIAGTYAYAAQSRAPYGGGGGATKGAGKSTALVPYYPGNNGFLGDVSTEVLSPGMKFDRYGYPAGHYGSPLGTPIEMRALSPGSFGKPYHIYEVLTPIQVSSGHAIPWFQQPGLGKQYFFQKSIEELLNANIIVEVTK